MAEKQKKAATPSPSRISTLMELAGKKTAVSKQGKLDLGIERQAEVDGVEMGVLSDGTPYLTGRGLATLCGVHHSVIQDINADWLESLPKARISSIRDILSSRGLSFESPFIPIRNKNVTVFAYPDSVCLAVLEYYAFEAGGKSRDLAVKNFRALAGHALREFIYVHVGYDPSANVAQIWKQFHDRVSLVYNAIPAGYFGIFKEIAEMIVTLGQAGIPIDDTFVPDISVGQCWAKHWDKSLYQWHYGERIKFDHNYPGYFPQADSNPQPSWCYPEAALGEFRRWFRENYIGDGKFASYLLEKVKQGKLPTTFAKLALEAYNPSNDSNPMLLP